MSPVHVLSPSKDVPVVPQLMLKLSSGVYAWMCVEKRRKRNNATELILRNLMVFGETLQVSKVVNDFYYY